MALEPRFHRRKFGEAISEALEISRHHHRFVRGMHPPANGVESTVSFLFMTLAVPDIPGITYERYRQTRLNMLEVYALSFLEKQRHLERVIGIGTEPLPPDDEDKGRSEDLVLAEAQQWTDEALQGLEEQRRVFDVHREGRTREFAMTGAEWPDVKREQRPDPWILVRTTLSYYAARHRNPRRWQPRPRAALPQIRDA